MINLAFALRPSHLNYVTLSRATCSSESCECGLDMYGVDIHTNVSVLSLCRVHFDVRSQLVGC